MPAFVVLTAVYRTVKADEGICNTEIPADINTAVSERIVWTKIPG